jgi:hypothetical protein
MEDQSCSFLSFLLPVLLLQMGPTETLEIELLYGKECAEPLLVPSHTRSSRIKSFPIWTTESIFKNWIQTKILHSRSMCIIFVSWEGNIIMIPFNVMRMRHLHQTHCQLWQYALIAVSIIYSCVTNCSLAKCLYTPVVLSVQDCRSQQCSEANYMVYLFDFMPYKAQAWLEVLLWAHWYLRNVTGDEIHT